MKFNYSFKALQPVHTGADDNTGTEKKLRREKVVLAEPLKLKSKFNNDKERVDAIVSILLNVWRNIDFDGMQSTRLITIYDEFTSKVLASASVKTKEKFLNRLCSKFDIRSLNDVNVIETLELFNDEEFLGLIRDETLFIVLKLRKQIKDEKDKNKNLSLFSVEKQKEKNIDLDYVKSIDYIPYISGNSIRGYLRRLVMRDFLNQVEITQLFKDTYHQLFTGGNITDSTGLENIEAKEKFMEACPPIALLGSAIGNQTIEGHLKVGGARLKCKEFGTGDMSFWELTETKFQTRLDSSKTETEINILSNEKSVNQMIYYYETFIVNSEFTSSFMLTTDKTLLVSCFWRMIELWKENNYICGSSARDNGLIQINIDVPDNASFEYLEYLKENKEKIQKYFNPELFL